MTGAPVHGAAGGTTVPDLRAPSLRRRLASFVYEGVLLFGVVMLAGLAYSWLTEQRHALRGTAGLQAFVFVVLAIYFVTFWSRGGQTVAMKTWRLRLVTRDGGPVGQGRALLRYLLSWLWFVPGLATVKLAQLSGAWPVALVLMAGVVAYASLVFLHPARQFWHDVVCGTRLVDWPRRP